MTSTYLASLAAECPLADLAAVDDFQRSPSAPHRRSRRRALGLAPLSLVPRRRLRPGHPARVITTLISVAAQHTAPGSFAWNNEPDLFDTLRRNMKARESTLDALLLDFSIARAFIGSRSDGMHMTGTERFGDFGRVRFEWSVPLTSLPAASPRPARSTRREQRTCGSIATAPRRTPS